MKKLIPLFVLLTTSVYSFGQTSIYHPFPDSNTVWVQSFGQNYGSPCWDTDDQNLYIAGDTVIGTHTYHKLMKNGYVSEFCPPPKTPFPPYYYFRQYWGAFRQDIPNKRVFLNVSGFDTLAYDFNMGVGNIVPATFLNQYGTLTVLSIDSVQVGDHYNKRYNLDNGLPSIIEGIGNTFGAFCMIETPFEWSAGLYCVRMNGEMAWTYDTAYTACTLITGIESLRENFKLSVYPNPFSEETTIRASWDLESADLVLIDVLGREVKRIMNISGRTVKLQRENLPAGVYIVRLTQMNKIIASERVVITN